VVSQTTRDLLDEAAELRDLGEHRLKDLSAPQRLFQVGSGDFPRLKTLYQTNLPVQPTPLVGRRTELAEVVGLLSEGRLVTLTGAGGSGKTRLALQAAAELADAFPHGVWWVSLAALRDPELVESTIGQAVGATAELVDRLRSWKALLLLDNFEHVVAAAPAIAALLAGAPEVRVLATSRERLALAAEQEYSVPTLAPPDAIELFTARARQLEVGFEPNDAVAEICRSLDGLPLAVELAAARIKVLSPEGILGRLGRSLDLLTAGPRDAPERQRTLRATIDWSYELLDAGERELFARLAVFAGSVDLDAAEGVAGADLDTLAALVDKSLLRRTDEGRFFMLETIREFAYECLVDMGAAPEIRARHADYFLRFAERLRPVLWESPPTVVQFEQEYENVRAALAWSDEIGDCNLLLRLAASASDFWMLRSYLREGRDWLERALAGDGDDAVARARSLASLSSMEHTQGEYDAARRHAAEAAAIFEELGDGAGTAFALNRIGNAFAALGDSTKAEPFYARAVALARDARDDRELAISLLNAGALNVAEGRSADGKEACAAAFDVFTRLGNPAGRARAAFFLALIAIGEGRLDDAMSSLATSMLAFAELDRSAMLAPCFEAAAAISMRRGDPARAIRLLAAAAAVREEFGTSPVRSERALRDEVLAAVTERVDADTFSALWREGGELDPAAAVEHALSPVD
jgi:predicted ATPase